MASIENIPSSESDLVPTFKELPVDKQQQMTSELSAELGGISILKLPNESHDDFRIRSLSELPPSNSDNQSELLVIPKSIVSTIVQSFEKCLRPTLEVLPQPTVFEDSFVPNSCEYSPIEPFEGIEHGFNPKYNEFAQDSCKYSLIALAEQSCTGSCPYSPIELVEPGFNPKYNESNNQSLVFSTSMKTQLVVDQSKLPPPVDTNIVNCCHDCYSTIKPVEGEEAGFNPNYNGDSKN